MESSGGQNGTRTCRQLRGVKDHQRGSGRILRPIEVGRSAGERHPLCQAAVIGFDRSSAGGCRNGGSAERHCRRENFWICERPQHPLGTALRSAPAHAAFINGIAAHAQELDDFGGVDHSGAVVVPALLAIGEALPPVTGKGFSTAMVVGYEVGREFSRRPAEYRAHNNASGWHSTGTCGSFGAAAAVAKVLGIDAWKTTWAIGLAGTFTGGTWAFIKDGAMSKRYHAGRAAETGVVSACLARSGFTGRRIFLRPIGAAFSRPMPKARRSLQD